METLLAQTLAALKAMGGHLLILSAATAASPAAEAVEHAEARMYAADFADALATLDAELADPARASDARLSLLVQKLRVQQNARLAGVTLGDEQATAAEIEQLAITTDDRDLSGQALLRLTVSRYFTRIMAGETADLDEFVPMFLEAADKIEAPCRRGEALFFAALMPQAAGRVAQSAGGLETARAAARGCPLEMSYVDRHLAAVAEEAGDLAEASDLAARSSATRRRIGFDVFLPFSLLLEADLEEKAGNEPRVRDLVREAAELSAKLRLPASLAAACGEAARRDLAFESCPIRAAEGDLNARG